jgi:D-methionine transport system substrate-binding protein
MKLTNIIFCGLITFFLTACDDSSKSFKVGVTAGPHAIIMDEVKKLADKDGFKIKVVEFNDFNLPNAALENGDVDINVYQHEPFLNDQMKHKGYDFVVVGKSIVLPLGLYSNKLKSIDEVQKGATVAIPNDPTNEGRALKLLEQAQLIKLQPSDNPTPLDIVDNPLQLKIVEVEAPQVPRIIDDVSLAVTNTDWMVLARKDPRTALIRESAPSQFVNVIVAKRQDKDNPNIQQFLKIYHSDAVKQFIKDKFAGAVEPAW